MAAGDFVRFSGPVSSKSAITGLSIPVHASGHAVGNTVVVFGSHTANGALSGVTDSKGNTYTQAVLDNGVSPRAGIWFSVLTTPLVSGDTILVSYSATQNRGQVHIAAEFEGAGTFQSPGVTASATSGSPSSGNKTPSSAPAVAVGWIAGTGEMTDLNESGSWIEIAAGNSGTAGADATNVVVLAMRQALANTNPVAATGTITSTSWTAQIAVFGFAAAPINETGRDAGTLALTESVTNVHHMVEVLSTDMALTVDVSDSMGVLEEFVDTDLALTADVTDGISMVENLPVASGEGYVVMDASGEFVTTPDHNDFDFSGDVDIRVKVRLPDYTPDGGNIVLLEKWETSGNQRSFLLQLIVAGRLQFLRSPNGATPVTTAQSGILTGVTNDTDVWLRVTFVASTGAVEFFTSSDGSSWTSQGGQTAAGVGIFAGTAAVRLGDDSVAVGGRFYLAQFRSAIDGTIVADPDFRDGDQTSDGGATFVDSSAKTWTLTGGAAWSAPAGGLEILFTTEVTDALGGQTENVETDLALTESVTDVRRMVEVLSTDLALTVDVVAVLESVESLSIDLPITMSATDVVGEAPQEVAVAPLDAYFDMPGDITEVSVIFEVAPADVVMDVPGSGDFEFMSAIIEDLSISLVFSPDVVDEGGVTVAAIVDVGPLDAYFDVPGSGDFEMVEGLIEDTLTILLIDEGVTLVDIAEFIQAVSADPLVFSVDVVDARRMVEVLDVSLALTSSVVSVHDQVEALSTDLALTTDVVESLDLLEVPSIDLVLETDADDSMPGAEDTGVSLVLSVDVVDDHTVGGQTFTENVSTDLALTVTTTEVVSAAEALSTDLALTTSATGAVSGAESVVVALVLTESVVAHLGASEGTQADLALTVSVTEISAVSEALSVPLALIVDVDDVAFFEGAEFAETDLALEVSVVEVADASESRSIDLALAVSGTGAVSMTEDLVVAISLEATAVESGGLSEPVEAGFLFTTSGVEALSMIESGSVSLVFDLETTETTDSVEAVSTDLVLSPSVTTAHAIVESVDTDVEFFVSSSLSGAGFEALETGLVVEATAFDDLTMGESVVATAAFDLEVETVQAMVSNPVTSMALSASAETVQAMISAAETLLVLSASLVEDFDPFFIPEIFDVVAGPVVVEVVPGPRVVAVGVKPKLYDVVEV